MQSHYVLEVQIVQMRVHNVNVINPINIKEGCSVTEKRETLARISYQRFFRRYLMLAGMTGTAAEIRSELWNTYGLTTVKIATNRPCLRCCLPNLVLPTAEEKWLQVLETARNLHGQGRPILIGTRSVADSELVGALFDEAGIDFRLLNALLRAEDSVSNGRQTLIDHIEHIVVGSV